MKGKKARAAISAVSFVLVLALMVQALTYITWDKGGKAVSLYRREEPGSLDVLFVGASQVMCGVYPMDLYHDFGITSYDYTVSASLLPQSYYCIIEALKTQHPEVLVLDVSGVVFDGKVSTLEYAHSQLDSMPWSENKLRALEDLIESPGDRLEFYIPLIRFHTRWKDLNRDDLLPITGTTKGAAVMDGLVVDPDPAWAVVTDEVLQPPEVAEEYLRRSLDYCLDAGVPVLLLTMPVISYSAPKYYNAVKAVAGEYGVPYLDLSAYLDDMGFDLSADMRDEFHCNISGACKVTDYIGRYLKEHYDLPDRRADGSLAGDWDRAYQAYKEEYPY